MPALQGRHRALVRRRDGRRSPRLAESGGMLQYLPLVFAPTRPRVERASRKTPTALVLSHTTGSRRPLGRNATAPRSFPSSKPHSSVPVDEDPRGARVGAGLGAGAPRSHEVRLQLGNGGGVGGKENVFFSCYLLVFV
ncbi:hypothetical protein HJG60_011679 [Phyllostomus discolor]|uniref:Uncharacterized protein n=1 Tax=Phyllostomus discolor TaxID=89673 RepID=A0A833ZP20_9CHIR|nr:hypothetical protein HJG60_011679 [Phyllostomus discolor]